MTTSALCAPDNLMILPTAPMPLEAVPVVEQPSGTVAFLFTDIEASTQRWEEYPDEMCVAVATHDDIIRSAIRRHGGYVFATTGDGFAVAFTSVAAATRAAIDARNGLEAHPWPLPKPIRSRMGIHVGEAHERDGNYFGSVVNRTARIMAAGHGGQVLLSAAAAAVAEVDGLVDLGRHRLKDLVAPEQLYQLGIDEFQLPRTLGMVCGRAGLTEGVAEVRRIHSSRVPSGR